MSPIGGIGINLAIQDAVATANVLAAPLARGENPDQLLHRVQERRLFPTRVIQAGQKVAQDNVIGTVLPARQSPAPHGSCGCSTASRCCGEFRGGSSVSACGGRG